MSTSSFVQVPLDRPADRGATGPDGSDSGEGAGRLGSPPAPPARSADAVPRLRLLDGTRLLERGQALEVATAAASTVVRGLDDAGRRVLRQLARTEVPATEVPAPLRALLEGAGLLEDCQAVARELGSLGLPPGERARLRPDLAAAALQGAERDGGAGVLRSRRAAVVQVRGLGRLGAVLLALLRDSGIDLVEGCDDGVVGHEDLAPGGHPTASLGDRRAAASSRSPRSALRPHLVVVVEEGPSRRLECERLSRSSQPHLVVTCRTDELVVGPLVIPGATSCRRCLDCARSDRDPEWPSVAASEEHLPRTAPPVVLAVAGATLAAAEVLAWVEGRSCRSINSTLHVAPDLGQVIHRWSPHPHCGCRWQPFR